MFFRSSCGADIGADAPGRGARCRCASGCGHGLPCSRRRARLYRSLPAGRRTHRLGRRTGKPSPLSIAGRMAGVPPGLPPGRGIRAMAAVDSGPRSFSLSAALSSRRAADRGASPRPGRNARLTHGHHPVGPEAEALFPRCAAGCKRWPGDGRHRGPPATAVRHLRRAGNREDDHCGPDHRAAARCLCRPPDAFRPLRPHRQGRRPLE